MSGQAGTLWEWLKGAIGAIDAAMTGLFTVPEGKSKVAVYAGRGLLLILVCFVVTWLVGWLNPPLRSTLLEAAQVPDGLVYALPRTEIVASGHFDVTGCSVSPAATPMAQPIVHLTSTLTVDSIEAVAVADPAARYVVSSGSIAPPLLGEGFEAALSPTGVLESIGKTTTSPVDAATALARTISAPFEHEISNDNKTNGASQEATACRGLPSASDEEAPPRSFFFKLRYDPLEAPSARWMPSVALAGFSDAVNTILVDKVRVLVHACATADGKTCLPLMEGEAPKLPESADGLVYRYPTPVAVYVCRGECAKDGVLQVSNIVEAKSLPLMLPGKEAKLTVTRDWLNKASFSAGYNTSGGLSGLKATPGAEEEAAKPAAQPEGAAKPDKPAD